MKYANNLSTNSIYYYVDKNIKLNCKNMSRCKKGIAQILKHQNKRYLGDKYYPMYKLSSSNLNAMPSSFIYLYYNCHDLYSDICNKSNWMCKKINIIKAKHTIY